MKYLKAVYRTWGDDHPVSIMFQALPPGSVLQYPQNEWVESSNGSPLFVCTDLAEAIDHGGAYCEIWECDVEEPRSVGGCPYPDVFADTEAVGAFWRGEDFERNSPQPRNLRTWLNGPYTVANRVRLTKKLDPMDYKGKS